MTFFRVYENQKIVAEIEAMTLEHASGIIARAYKGQTMRVEPV